MLSVRDLCTLCVLWLFALLMCFVCDWCAYFVLCLRTLCFGCALGEGFVCLCASYNKQSRYSDDNSKCMKCTSCAVNVLSIYVF